MYIYLNNVCLWGAAQSAPLFLQHLADSRQPLLAAHTLKTHSWLSSSCSLHLWSIYRSLSLNSKLPHSSSSNFEQIKSMSTRSLQSIINTLRASQATLSFFKTYLQTISTSISLHHLSRVPLRRKKTISSQSLTSLLFKSASSSMLLCQLMLSNEASKSLINSVVSYYFDSK